MQVHIQQPLLLALAGVRWLAEVDGQRHADPQGGSVGGQAQQLVQVLPGPCTAHRRGKVHST